MDRTELQERPRTWWEQEILSVLEEEQSENLEQNPNVYRRPRWMMTDEIVSVLERRYGEPIPNWEGRRFWERRHGTYDYVRRRVDRVIHAMSEEGKLVRFGIKDRPPIPRRLYGVQIGTIDFYERMIKREKEQKAAEQDQYHRQRQIVKIAQQRGLEIKSVFDSSTFVGTVTTLLVTVETLERLLGITDQEETPDV